MTEESAQAFADAISRRVRSTSSKPVQSRLSQLGLSRNGRSSRPSTSNTHSRLDQSVEGKRADHQRDEKERDRSHLRETRPTSPDKSLLDGPHSMVASAMYSAVPSPRHRVDDRLLSPAHPRTPPKRMSLASGGGDASVGHQHLASNHHQHPQPHQQHHHHHHYHHHPPMDTAPSPGMTPVARPNTGKPGQTLIERRAANVPPKHANSDGTDVRGKYHYDGTTDVAACSDQRLRSAAPPPLDLSRQASLLSLHLPRNQTAAGPQRFPVNSALSTALPADPISPTIALAPTGGLGALTNKQQGAVTERSPATTPRHVRRTAADDRYVDEKNRVPDLVAESEPRNVPHRRVPQPPAKTPPQKVRPEKPRVGQTASSKQAHRLLSATTKHHPQPPLDHSSPKQMRDAETNSGDGGEPQRHPSSTLLTPTTGHTAPSVASLSATSLATPTMPSPRTMGGASPSSKPVVPAVVASSPLGSGPNALPASPASHTSTTQGRGRAAGLGSPTSTRASPRHHAKEQSGVYEGGVAGAGAAGQTSPGSLAPGSPASTMRSPRAARGGDKSSFRGPHTPRNPHKTQSDLNQTMLSKKGSDRLGASKNAAISVAAATAVIAAVTAPPPKQLSAQELQLFKRTPSLYPCPARTYLQLHQCLLQNNTLCGFGGLEAYPSLVFQWVQQRLACRPGCRAVYSEACRRLRVPTSNAVLEQLPYTPGRYFNTRKAVEASGSVFGDTQFIALLPVLRVCRATEVLVGRGCLISDVSIYALAESLVVPGTDPFNEELHARLAEIPSLIEQAKKIAEEEEKIQRRQLPHQQALMRAGGRRNSLVQNSSLMLKADSSVLARSTSPTGGAAGTAFASTGAFDDNADPNVHTSRSEHQPGVGAEPPAQEKNEKNALLRRMSASDGDRGTGEADDEAGVSKTSMSEKPTPTARGRRSSAPTPPLVVGDSSTLFSAEKTKFDKAQSRAFSTFASPEWKSRGSKFCGPSAEGSGPTTGEGGQRSAPATGRPPRHDQRFDHSKQQLAATPQTARGPQTNQHQEDQSSRSRQQTPPGPPTRPSHSRERNRSAHASPSPNRDRSTAESNSRPASRAPGAAKRGGEGSPSRIGASSSPRRPTSQSKSRSRRHSTDDSSSVNGGDLQRVLEIPVSSARLFDFSATCSSVDDDEDIDESDPRNKHRRSSRRDSTAFSANEGRQQLRRSSAHPHGSGQSPVFGQNQSTQGGAVGGKHRTSLLFNSSATSAAQESLASHPPGFDGPLPKHGSAKRGSEVSSCVLESQTGDDATSASAWRSEPQSAQDRPILFRVQLIDEEGEHVNANSETPRSFGVPHPPGHGGPGTSPGGAPISSGTHGAQHQSALMLDEPTAVEGVSSREMHGRDPDSPSCSLAGEPHRNGNGILHPHDDDGNAATLRPSDQESSPNAGGEFSIPAVAGHARRSQVNIALTPTFIAGGGGGAARGGADPSKSPGRRSLVSPSPTRMRSPSTAGGAGSGTSRRASNIHGAGGADSPFSDSPPCKGSPSEPKQLLDPAQLFLQSIHNAERALTAPKRGSMSPPPRRASQAPSPAPAAPSYNRAGSPARKSIVGRAGPRASRVSQTSDTGFGGGGGGNGNEGGGLMFGGHNDLPIPSASATQIAAAAVYSPSMSPTRSILQQLARGSLFSHAGDDPDDPIQDDGRRHDAVRPAGAMPGGSPAGHVVSSTHGAQAQQQQQQQLQRQRESIVSGSESSKQKHRTPASTRRLTSLELSSNPNITDLSIPALIQLAIAIPTLTRICVQKTGISPRGAALLRDVLESNSRRSKRASRGRHGARRSQFFSSAFHEGSKDRGLFSSSKSIHSGRDGTVSDRVSTAKRQQTVNTLSAEDFHHAVRAFSALMTPGTGVVDLQTLSQIQPHVAASVRRKLAAQAGDDLKKNGKSKPGTTIGSASVMASMFTHQQTDEDENEHNRFSKPFSANDTNEGSDGNSKGANAQEGGSGGAKRTRRPGRAPARASGPDATAVNFVVYCEATHPTLPHDVLLRELTQHSEYILAQPMAPPVMDRLTTEQRLDALDVFGELCAVSDDRIVAAAKAKSEKEKAEKAKQKAVLARLGIEDDEDSSLYTSGSDRGDGSSSSLSSSDGDHRRDDSESRHVRKKKQHSRRSGKNGKSPDEEEDPRKAIKGRIWDETETPRSRPIATFLSAAALRAQLPSEAGKEALDFVLRRNAGIARRGGWTTDEFVAMASTMYVEQRLRKRLQSADK